MSDTTKNISDEAKASFGFKSVNIDEKQGMVNQVFAKTAKNYDLMNDVLTGGIHRLWKDDFINWLAPPKGDKPYKLLDVAGGTGDITERVIQISDKAHAIICDISPEMLEEGKKRAEKRGLENHITFVEGNAEKLPFTDKSFDAYTIAFGIRNVTDIDQALKEAYRVLKPGGRFLCLEFSEVQTPILDKIYDLYSFNVMPKLGEIVAGNKDSYEYLVESIRRFPDQEKFTDMIKKAGFDQVKHRNLTGGIAAIHSAWRL